MKRATAGAIFGDTFRVFGKNIPVYLGLYLLYAAVTTALTLLWARLLYGIVVGTIAVPPNLATGSFADVLFLFFLATLVVAFIGALIGSILTATLTYYAYRRYRNEQVTLGGAFGRGVRRFLSVLGASIVQGVIVACLLLVPLGFMGAGIFMFNLCLIGIAGIVLVLIVPIAIYIVIALSLYAPAIMIEGKGAVGGLIRSWELTSERRMTLFVALLGITILSVLVSVTVSLFLGSSFDPYVRVIGTIIPTMITGSWTVIFGAVAYHQVLPEEIPKAWPQLIGTWDSS